MTQIVVTEVGPRDGLQNEPRPIPAADKIRLIDLLSAAGFARIEAASFVSPRWVPQMADGAEVMAGIERNEHTVYSVLTPNLQGYEAARAARADEVAIFAAASETFSQKNINAGIDESLERFRPVAEAAAGDGVPLRGYVSCVVECPYEGPIAPQAVARVVERLLALGCREVSLGDTVGKGTPETVEAMLKAVLEVAPPGQLAGHYHDTNGRALDSVAVSIEHGLGSFDAAIGGLGGCPYAPGAKGNLSTVKLVEWLDLEKHAHGVDHTALGRAERFARELREKPDGG